MEKVNQITPTNTNSHILKRLLGFVAFFTIIILLGLAIVASKSEPKNSEKVWDIATTVGNPDAKNYFIIYADIMCPYCVAFENAIFNNEESFEKYIEDNDILIEVRLSDFLYQYGESRPINSRYSALATYCAKNEGKFWDYYKLAITTVWNNYYSTLGKSAFTELNRKDKDYWLSLGKKIGLGDVFETCVKNDEALSELNDNTAKTAKLASGMPYFKFNKFSSSGFSLDGGWYDVLRFFQAGLDS